MASASLLPARTCIASDDAIVVALRTASRSQYAAARRVSASSCASDATSGSSRSIRERISLLSERTFAHRSGGHNSQPMSLSPSAAPESFLTARVTIVDGEPKMTTLCAGFERGEWRQDGFVKHLFDYLLEFAMKWSELKKLNSGTAVRMIEDAARRVYETEKYGKRGEFGELLLHAALRSHFNSEPAVAKLFYKSADNDTVKGFDCVHVVVGADEMLELWLGEAKFYADIGDALQAAFKSLSELTTTERLKREFVLVRGLVDDKWPYADQFKALLNERRSLDEVFQVLRIPVRSRTTATLSALPTSSTQLTSRRFAWK